MPYPKAARRIQSSRGRQRGISRILTDATEKAEIEQLALKQLGKESIRQEKKTLKTRNNELFNSTDKEKDGLRRSPDSSVDYNFLSHNKTMKFYVGKVLCLKGNSLEVKFLRQEGLVGS